MSCVRACARFGCLVRSGPEISSEPLPFSLLPRDVFPFPLRVPPSPQPPIQRYLALSVYKYPIAFGRPATVPNSVTKSTTKCNEKQDGTPANFQKHSQVFLYPPELPFPRGLYSAHKSNPNIMKNRTKRSPIFKNAPKFLYRCLALFSTGGHIFWNVCVESDLKWEQNGVIMKPLAPF